MVRFLFLFLTRFHVNVARSNGNPTRRAFQSYGVMLRFAAEVLCVRVSCKTRRSFIRSFSRLSYDASYLRIGVKGRSKIRRVVAKSRLILDETCRLHGKFASYFSSYKWPYRVPSGWSAHKQFINNYEKNEMRGRKLTLCIVH